MTVSADPRPVYLDYAATTPVHPAVLQAMDPWLKGRFGNPSSLYPLGFEARQALDRAREQCATVLGCLPDEIVFTSGATESDNLALKGVLLAQRRHGRTHLVTTAIEHSAVLEAAADLADWFGIQVTLVPPRPDGIVDPEAIAAALRPDTALVSVMLANNEIGTLQPLPAIARHTRAAGTPLHTDAVQAAGAVPLDVDTLGVDLLSLTAHKCYGPKGTGLLYLRRGTPFQRLQSGGGQEDGRRGGTENVAGIVGLGEALALVDAHRPAVAPRLAAQRDALLAGLRGICPDLVVNGSLEHRLPGNLDCGFPGVNGETLLLDLEAWGICASAGSACHAGSTEPSHVLLALGVPEDLARSALRLTLGAPTSDDDIARALEAFAAVLPRLRTSA